MAVPEIVGMAEAADILGFSRTNFNQHRKRYESDPESGFPAPLQELRCGPIWEKSKIEKWNAKYIKAVAAKQKLAADRKAAAAKPKVAEATPAAPAAPAKKKVLAKK